MTSLELRKGFLNFFEKKGHKVVPSSSLIPTDPSVLLTSAVIMKKGNSSLTILTFR